MRQYLASLSFLLLMAMLIKSCVTKENGLSQKDIEAIQNLDSSYVELSKKNNWDQLSSLMTNDVVVFPPNDSAVIGKNNNLNRFKSFGNLPIQYSHSLTELNGSNQLAYLHGNYEIKIQFPDTAIKPFSDIGKYLWVLKKEKNEDWKIHRIIWNSNVKIGH